MGLYWIFHRHSQHPCIPYHQTYLDIFNIRMGKRLTYQIDIPDLLLDIQIPPMIIQPLVENAIKHGLEPKIEGGDIFIKAFLKKDKLIIEVSDTGMGIQGLLILYFWILICQDFQGQCAVHIKNQQVHDRQVCD